MMKNLLKGVFLPLIILFVACGNDEEVVQNDFLFEEYKPGDKITLESVNGGKKTLLRTEKGFVLDGDEKKVLMFDFFGTFCAPCKEEAVDLTQLWKNNAKDFFIIGLTHFEDVSDEVVKKFANDFGAYYFLSNSAKNERIIAQILKDIDYQSMEQLPFKVVLKDGIYQNLSDFWNKGMQTSFYLGKVPKTLMQEDINKIIGR